MSRDEAINYLISSGMSQEQIDTVVEALSGKCEECPSYNVGYICGYNNAVYSHDELLQNPEKVISNMTNKAWIAFLSVQFNISRKSAKDMLHVMMKIKHEDNFKKQFNCRKEQ